MARCDCLMVFLLFYGGLSLLYGGLLLLYGGLLLLYGGLSLLYGGLFKVCRQSRKTFLLLYCLFFLISFLLLRSTDKVGICRSTFLFL